MKRMLPVTISLLLVAGCAWAAPPADPGPRGARGMTPEQAASRAKSRFGGRVLDVKPVPGGQPGAPAYRVKLLDRGEIRTVTVPADPPRDKKNARPRR